LSPSGRTLARGVLPSFPTRRSSDLVLGCEVHDRPDTHGRRRNPQAVLRRTCRCSAVRAQRLRARGDSVRARNVSGSLSCRGSASASHTSDRKSTRLNSSHVSISYAVFCLKKKIIYTT